MHMIKNITIIPFLKKTFNMKQKFISCMNTKRLSLLTFSNLTKKCLFFDSSVCPFVCCSLTVICKYVWKTMEFLCKLFENHSSIFPVARTSLAFTVTYKKIRIHFSLCVVHFWSTFLWHYTATSIMKLIWISQVSYYMFTIEKDACNIYFRFTGRTKEFGYITVRAK